MAIENGQNALVNCVEWTISWVKDLLKSQDTFVGIEHKVELEKTEKGSHESQVIMDEYSYRRMIGNFGSSTVKQTQEDLAFFKEVHQSKMDKNKPVEKITGSMQ